jgi:cell fate regulator YaaT (PSP1 superfamily)
MSLALKIISNGRIIPFVPTKLSLVEGDDVLIEVLGCQERATICEFRGSDSEDKSDTAEESPEIIRKLTEADKKRCLELKNKARETLDLCRQRISAHNLEMELLDAELSFDEKKLTFFFSATGRVDFRSLVSDLASNFKKLIRLQQVGARDEARHLQGVGRCGRPFCCSSFLSENLDEITLDMARCQQLAHMGSNRITGGCGKLMCCLKYELKDYEKNLKDLPKIGEEVKIKEGDGIVVDLNVLKKKVTVQLKEGNRVEVDWSKS